MNIHSLLPFSAAGLERKAVDDGINTLNLSLAQLVRGTEIEVYQTVLLLEKSRTNMEALQLTENMALRSYQLTQQAYRNGLAELLEVQSALIEYQKAQNEVLKENFNYLSGLIDLEYAIGVPFGTLSEER
jgi:outer membrane protein TolC